MARTGDRSEKSLSWHHHVGARCSLFDLSSLPLVLYVSSELFLAFSGLLGFRSGAVQISVLPDQSLNETAQYPKRTETFKTGLLPECLYLADIKTKK